MAVRQSETIWNHTGFWRWVLRRVFGQTFVRRWLARELAGESERIPHGSKSGEFCVSGFIHDFDMLLVALLLLFCATAEHLGPTIPEGEVIGKVYGNRRDLTLGTVFRDCSFSSTSDKPGGAIFVNGGSLRLFLVGCRFSSCSSAKAGGAICMQTGLVFSMTMTQGDYGFAMGSGGFSYVRIRRHGGWFVVSECRVSESRAAGGGILRFDATGTGTPKAMLMTSVNLTDNEALSQGSAMWFSGAFNFVPIKDSILAGGSPANCLAFDAVGESNLTNVRLLNNSCKSSGVWQGLIAVKGTTLNLMNCLFQANVVSDYWLGFRTRNKIAFFDCVLDDVRLATAGANGTVVTVHCLERRLPGLPNVYARQGIRLGEGDSSPSQSIAATASPSYGFTPVGPKDWTRGQIYKIVPLFIFFFHVELRPLN
jgi:hypothetical protein